MSVSSIEPVYMTGGTGYIGRHLREQLRKEGYSVTLLLRPGTKASLFPNESMTQGDVTDPASLDVSGHDSVLHLAAQTDVEGAIEEPDKTWSVNATGTLNVLEAARDADVEQFLYTSTSRVYGTPETLPIDESHPTAPVEPYGTSKLAGDRCTITWGAAYDFSTVVVRLFNSFGMGQPTTNVAAHIADQIQSEGPVELRELSPERDFLYAPDVVNGILTALRRGESGEVYNIGRGSAISVGELARLAIQAAGVDTRLVETGDGDREEGSIQKNVADSSKLRALGWKPSYSVKEGLEVYFAD